MEAFSAETFAAILALIGAVIIVAALLSGLIERSNLPQVAVFLALGAVLGPPGLGLLNITLQSPALRVVATLSLAGGWTRVNGPSFSPVALSLVGASAASLKSHVRRHGG